MKNKLQNMKAKVQELRNKKGFTLIELIVVIAVLGILVLLAAPKFLGYTQDANVTTLKADAKVLENASLVFHVDNEVDGNPGAWPIDTTKEFTLTTADTNGDGTVDATDAMKGYAFQPVDAVDPVTNEALGLGDKVKTLKNDISNYALTANGEVFYVGDAVAGAAGAGTDVTTGVKDSDGNQHFGVAIVKAK